MRSNKNFLLYIFSYRIKMAHLTWDQKIRQLKRVIENVNGYHYQNEVNINNLIASYRLSDGDLRRMFCWPIGNINDQLHEATPIFNYLIYKGLFSEADRYMYLFIPPDGGRIRFNDVTGGLRNQYTNENPFHIAARSRRNISGIAFLMTKINPYEHEDLSVALRQSNEQQKTPLMVVLSKLVDMFYSNNTRD